MSSLQSQSNSHVSSIVQMAAITAAKLPPHYVSDMVMAFDRRRQFCMERLNRLTEYVTYTRPTGAFYFFLNFSRFLNAKKMTDVELCRDLLAKAQVGLVPGASFGQKNYVRLSYATNEEILGKAFDRIENYLKNA